MKDENLNIPKMKQDLNSFKRVLTLAYVDIMKFNPKIYS